MARPIKETPVLEGKDAQRFEKQIKENERRKTPHAEYQRALATFQSVKIRR